MLQQYEHIIGMMGELSYLLPEAMEGFDDMRLAAMLPSDLDPMAKNLVGLGLAIANGADGWVEHFVIHALQSGATRPQVVETIAVSMQVGGAAVLAHGVVAFETMVEYEARDRKHAREMMKPSAEPTPPRSPLEAESDTQAA